MLAHKEKTASQYAFRTRRKATAAAMVTFKGEVWYPSGSNQKEVPQLSIASNSMSLSRSPVMIFV
jgi:hypothetical protein